MIRLIELDFQPAGSPIETIYVEADRSRYEALERMRGNSNAVAPIHGRLTPEGETGLWTLRGSRIMRMGPWSPAPDSFRADPPAAPATPPGVARVVREMTVGTTSLAERDVTLPDGRIRTGRAFLRRPPFVGVLPMRPGLSPDGPPEVLLVDQYRDALDDVVREIPAGKIEAAELDEDPRQVAGRELAEETGLVAREWRKLIRGVLPSPGVTDELAEGLWAAWDLAVVPRRAEDAHLHSAWYPLPEAVAQVGTDIRDAKTIIALLLAERSWSLWPIV